MLFYCLKNITLKIFFLHTLAEITVIDFTDGIMKDNFIKASKILILLSEKKTLL